MMSWVLVVVLAYISIQVVNVLVLFFTSLDKTPASPSQWPNVAILVAARNEEANIVNCIQALLKLDYPVEQLQIFVGDDASTDATANLIKQFTQNHAHIKLIPITEKVGLAKGKANVLAQLIKHTQAPYIFITDADITVNPNWIKGMLPFVSEKTGIVSATTIVNGNNFWLGEMQHLDWLYFMGVLTHFSRLGIPGTAVGNNMLVTQQAYTDTGGYENIPFSVTEDYQLYQAVRKQHWQTRNILTLNTINFSAPQTAWLPLLHQRKRWLKGALGLPLYWWFIFFVFGSFYVFLGLLFLTHATLAFALWGVKIALQSLTIWYQKKLLKQKLNFLYLIQYEFYLLGITCMSAIFLILPIRLQWKNRTY